MALFTKKTWKNRKSEYPARRILTKENGTTEIVTVARSEGIVSEEGDAFSEANMNDLESRVLKAIGNGDIPEALGTDIVTALTVINSSLDMTGAHVVYVVFGTNTGNSDSRAFIPLINANKYTLTITKIEIPGISENINLESIMILGYDRLGCNIRANPSYALQFRGNTAYITFTLTLR